jgi:hypothetical protein
MSTTAPPTRSPASSATGEAAGPVHLEVSAGEFARRLSAGGHSPEEIAGLWEELARDEPAQARSRLADLGSLIAVYVGLLLVVAASISVLAIYWHGLGAGGVLAIVLGYLCGYLAAAEALRRRDLPQPADVLEAVAVGWVALTTYAVQELIGVWPGNTDGLAHIHSGLTTIAVVGLLAALVLLALRPDALLLVPVGLATGILALDLAELVFGSKVDDLSERQVGAFLMPVGVGWIVTGLVLDAARRRDYATWAHWIGLLMTGMAVIMVVPKTVPGFAVIGVLGALSLFFSAFDRHWSFTVVGAFGLFIAVSSALRLLGGIAPLVIAAAGLALIVVGLRWSSWREAVRASVLERMPECVRAFVMRLSPDG